MSTSSRRRNLITAPSLASHTQQRTKKATYRCFTPSIGFDFLIAYTSSSLAFMEPKSSSLVFRRTLSTRPNSPLPRSSSSTSNSRSNLPGHSSPETAGWAYRMHVRCFSGLGPIGLRPDFKNRGEVGEVTVELDDEEAERWLLDDRPCFEAES